MALQTRKPTGAVPWPLVLIEGPEKSGKSWSCAELSASAKVGRSLWLDLNEGAADEYGAVPGARYEVIEHDGSWASILGQVAAAKEEASCAAANGEKPVVLIVDSVTSEWEMLKDWASARAMTSAANRKRLREDPAAEVQVPMNLWNDAGARHRRLMTTLMTFPGIVVMTARGKEVASLDANGRPVENTKEYKVEGHKTLAYDASVWVRLSRERAPVVVGCRSVHAGIRPGVDEPQEAKGFTLEWLIFDILKCDPAKAHVRDLVEARPERTPEQIRDEALRPVTTPDRIRELYAEARDSGCEGIELANEHGDTETLAQMLYRIGTERKGTPAAAAAGAPSAGEAFENAAPAPPRHQGNGRPANGTAVRPAQAARPAQQPEGEIDEDAQAFADEVHEMLTLGALGEINTRAREAHKLAALIRNPATGGTGGLGQYIKWKRGVLEKAERALTDLKTAATAAGIDDAEMEHRLIAACGHNLEEASAEEMVHAAELIMKGAGLAA